MKRPLEWLVAGAILTSGSSCAEIPPRPVPAERVVPQEYELPPDVFSIAPLTTENDARYLSNHVIERELRRFGPWVQQWIEGDFTTPEREAPITLAFLPQRSQDAMIDFEYAGAFSPDYFRMTLPELGEGLTHEVVREAITHEVAHMVTVGEHALMTQPGYEGPTRQELEAYVNEVRNRPVIKTIQQGMVILSAYNQVIRGVQVSTAQMNLRTNGLLRKVRETRELRTRMERVQEYLSPEVKQTLEDQYGTLRLVTGPFEDRMHALMGAIEGFDREEQELEILVGSLWDPSSHDRIRVLTENAAAITQNELQQVLAAFEQAVSTVDECHELYDRAYFLAGQNQIEQEITNLDQDIASATPDLRTVLEERRSLYQQVMERRISARRLQQSLNGATESFNEMMATMADVGGIVAQVKESEVLGDDDEVFARVVASLMNNYQGDHSSQNEFSARDGGIDVPRDIAFLRRFNYNGQALFPQDVFARYQQGRQMRDQGRSADDVRAWHILQEPQGNHYVMQGRPPLLVLSTREDEPGSGR